LMLAHYLLFKKIESLVYSKFSLLFSYLGSLPRSLEAT